MDDLEIQGNVISHVTLSILATTNGVYQ